MEKYEILVKAKNLCSKKEKCRFDMVNKLIAWGIKTDVIEEIINELEKEKYIDEERYARAYIHDKFKFNQWGRLKLRNGLKIKKIDERIINRLLEGIDMTEYKNILKKIINTKMKTLKSEDHIKKQAKLLSYAYHKGFEPDITKSVLQSIYQKDDESNY